MTTALAIAAILTAWCLLSLPVGILVGRHLKARREFDDSLTALAAAVGVLPGAEVELSADYRHLPLYDGIAAFRAGQLHDEIDDYLKGMSA